MKKLILSLYAIIFLLSCENNGVNPATSNDDELLSVVRLVKQFHYYCKNNNIEIRTEGDHDTYEVSFEGEVFDEKLTNVNKNITKIRIWLSATTFMIYIDFNQKFRNEIVLEEFAYFGVQLMPVTVMPIHSEGFFPKQYEKYTSFYSYAGDYSHNYSREKINDLWYTITHNNDISFPDISNEEGLITFLNIIIKEINDKNLLED